MGALRLLQRLQHSAGPGLAETPAPYVWLRQDGCLPTAGLLLPGVAVACPYPLQATCPPWGPKYQLVEQGRTCCLHLSIRTKPACSRMLQGPITKHLSGPSCVQARSAQHGWLCSQGSSGEDFNRVLTEGFGARSGRHHPWRKIVESRTGCSGSCQHPSLGQSLLLRDLAGG